MLISGWRCSSRQISRALSISALARNLTAWTVSIALLSGGAAYLVPLPLIMSSKVVGRHLLVFWIRFIDDAGRVFIDLCDAYRFFCSLWSNHQVRNIDKARRRESYIHSLCSKPSSEKYWRSEANGTPYSLLLYNLEITAFNPRYNSHYFASIVSKNSAIRLQHCEIQYIPTNTWPQLVGKPLSVYIAMEPADGPDIPSLWCSNYSHLWSSPAFRTSTLLKEIDIYYDHLASDKSDSQTHRNQFYVGDFLRHK